MKTKGIKKAGVVLIALIMMIVSLGLQTSLVNADTASTITVYTTFFDKGNTVEGKAGTKVTDVSVVVKDLDGDKIYSEDEVNKAFHEQYCPDGISGYETGNPYGSGNMVTKLWGKSADATGYYKNNVATSGLNESFAEGDSYVIFNYTDEISYSDQFTYFDTKTKAVNVGKKLTFTLTQTGYNEGWATETKSANGVKVKVIDSNNIQVGSDYITEADGTVSITFDKAGTYYVQSYGKDANEKPIVPSICVVTVKADEPKEPVVKDEPKNDNDKNSTTVEDKTTEKSPNTGDGTEAIMWIITLVGASACVVGLKRKEDK